MLHFRFCIFFRRKITYDVKKIYKLCFLFLGMRKRSNSPAFSDKLLVFQQHKTAVRLEEISKHKNGREKKFHLALANHISPKSSYLLFMFSNPPLPSFLFGGFFGLVCFLFLILFWLLCNEHGVCVINKNQRSAKPRCILPLKSQVQPFHLVALSRAADIFSLHFTLHFGVRTALEL